MGELINGRTPEEIITGLKCEVPCYKCAYKEHNFMKDDSCSYYVEQDIIALIEHLESERDAALAKVPRWISVEERLPENDDLVLVRANGRAREIRWDGAYALATYGSEGWVLWDYEDDEVQHLKILHWIPLPEPPMEKEQDVGA